MSYHQRPRAPTLIPYTTLFRSHPDHRAITGDHRSARVARIQRAIELHRDQTTGVIATQTGNTRTTDGHGGRSEGHTSELQSPCNLVCRLLLEKKNARYQ